MNSAHPAANKLSFKRCFFLFHKIVGKLYWLVVRAINLVPYKTVNVFALAFNPFENVLNWTKSLLRLFTARVKQRCQLFQFISVQQIYVHHIYKGAAVVKLLLGLVKLHIELLKTLIAKRLADSVD